jgi:CBS domain-containing protein
VDTEKEAVRMLVKRPAVVVDPDATLRRVAATLADDYIGVAVLRGTRPMGAPGSHAEGAISERDIVRALADGADPDVELAQNVMTLDLATVPGDTIMRVTECMLDNEIRHVPLTEDSVIVGVVSERDASRAFVEERRIENAQS